MEITGLQVIRDLPAGVPVEVAPPGKLELTYGETLRITVGGNYRGPAQNVRLYGALGVRGLYFDELINNEVVFSTPNSPDGFSPFSAFVDIPITADIDPGENYDIYVKIREFPEAGLPEVDNVIDITGVSPDFKLLEETIYPYAYVYDGPTESSVFTFTSLPFTPADWQKGYFAAKVEEEVKKSGGRVLTMKIYVDESLWIPWTNWRIEVEGVPPVSVGVGMALGLTWWAIAILAALAIALIVVLTWSITTIISSFTHKGLSEEIKATWSRESLISVIGDFEDKLERTPTPVEELQQKSDQELRDYCDSLAEEIVPPGAGLGLAVAVAGILGLGVLAIGAYAMSQQK